MKNKIKWLFLLAFVIGMSYREVQILIDRGSWRKEDYWIPLWYINWQSKWKNFDSFHFIHGLAILFLVEFLLFSDALWVGYFTFLPMWLSEQMFVAAYWFVFFQIRNLLMHKIFRRN